MCVGIDDPDDGAVCGRFVAFERERGLFAAAPENQFAFARTNRVESDRWRAFRLKIGVERLHDQKLSPIEGLVLDGCYDGSNDTRAICI